PDGLPIAIEPDFTAFMISSSCGISVLPKNCMSSAPLERALTSFAIHSKLIAADSDDALMCAKTSFLGAVCAKAGARLVARMPAMPAPARSSVRRLNDFVRVIISILPICSLQAQQASWPGRIQNAAGEASGLAGR